MAEVGTAFDPLFSMVFCTMGTAHTGTLFQIEGHTRTLRAEYQRDPRNVIRWRFEVPLGDPAYVIAFTLEGACRKFLAQSGFSPGEVEFCELPGASSE